MASGFSYYRNRLEETLPHRFPTTERRRFETSRLVLDLNYRTGTCFIMDNIAFHKSCIEQNSVRLLVQRTQYLPRGSPGGCPCSYGTAPSAETEASIESSLPSPSRARTEFWSKLSRAIVQLSRERLGILWEYLTTANSHRRETPT